MERSDGVATIAEGRWRFACRSRLLLQLSEGDLYQSIGQIVVGVFVT